VPVVLVGNKTDLSARRLVLEDQGLALATECGCGFIETSARRRTNVKAAFRMIMERAARYDRGRRVPAEPTVDLGAAAPAARWGCC